MNRTTQFAAIVVLVGGIGGTALAQSGGLAKQAEAARLQKLKAQRDAAIAAAKQRAAGNPTTTPTTSPTTPSTTISRTSPIPPGATTAAPTTTPTAAATTAPTTTPTAAATTTAKTAASASAAASNSAKPAGSAAPVGSAAPLPPKDRTDTAAIALDLEALKKSRADRRHAEVVDLQARFGDSLLADARSAPELKLHAQRIAYLQRIRALAVKANDAKLVGNVDIAITKEELRSANALNALRSGALPTVAAAPAAAPAGGTK